MTLGAIFASALVAYLPGALFFRAPFGSRPLRAALPAEERLFWAVILSVTWSCGWTLALAALGVYHFAVLLWSNALLSLIIALVSRFDLRLEEAPGPRLAALVPYVFVAAGLWLYFPPSEYVMGGKDPGTYINEGIQIAQRGTFLVQDPVIASVPQQYRDLFFPSHGNATYYSTRFMGFFIQDPGAGVVVGQFPHLFPASIAIGYGINGLSGARQAVGLWTILGLAAVYLTGARLIGRAPAAAGTALLTVNVIVVWFSRYPNAEVVMLALLSAGLLATARTLIDGNRWFSGIAGLLVGVLIFLRFDAVLAVAGVVAGALVARVQGRRMGWAFWTLLLLQLLLAAWYLTGPMRAYFALPVIFTQSLGLGALAAAALVLLAVFLWAAGRPAISSRLRSAIPLVYAAAVVLLAAYTYLVRQQEGLTALHDAMAFRTFAWYVTRPGLLLAVTGFAILALQRFWYSPTWFMTTAAFACFFFYKIRIVPEHFWMTRRFLPVILPAATLSIAALAFWIVRREGLQAILRRAAPLVQSQVPPAAPGRPRLPRPVWREALAIALVLPLGWSFWQASRPVLHHVEYAGLIPRLEQMASTFADDDLLIVESRNASDVHVLALPLAYIYARNVLVLNTPRPDKAALAGFLDWARGRYQRVFFMGGGGTDLLSKRIGVEAVRGDRFQIPEYESAWNAYPSGIRRKEFDYSLYQFVPPRPGPNAFVLDVGTDDDLLVLRFHAKEQHATGMTFRWSRDASYVSVLDVQPQTRTLTLWMSDGGRPERLPRAAVVVSIDGTELGRVTVDKDVRPYAFEIPEPVVAAAVDRDAPARLQLTTNTWNPKVALGVPDDRDLGIALDRVEAR